MKTLTKLDYKYTKDDLFIPQEIWHGETVFIIGGGPSLKQFDWDLISSRKVIGINDAYRLGPFIDYNIFGDTVWFRHHKEDMKYASCCHVGIVSEPLQAGNGWVNWMKRSHRKMTDKPGYIGWYGNTGMSGIVFAAMLGAVKIVLLGFDMKTDKNGDGNWHINPWNTPREKLYNQYMNWGQFLIKQWNDFYPNVEVVNCNLESAMDLFPKASIDDVLNCKEKK